MADTSVSGRARIPRDPANDYTHELAATRREFVHERTGAEIVPIGIAGPLRINGEHAQGEF
jgi:hydroxymethylglutaryl-CoA reductase (NADPH)